MESKPSDEDVKKYPRFSKCLGRYYERKGHKLQFRGDKTHNKTLDELAFDMSVLLDLRFGRRGFYPSSLWRVISGERLFTSEQLSTFCEVLGIAASEQAELENILAQERLRSSGLNLDFSISNVTVDLSQLLLKFIHDTRLQSNPSLAMDNAVELDHKLEQTIKSSSPSVATELIRIRTRLLIEQDYLFKETRSLAEIWSFSQKMVREITRMTEENGNPVLAAELAGGLAELYLGDTYHLLAKGPTTFHYLNESIAHVTTALDNLKDSDERLLAWRPLALAFGYLNEPEHLAIAETNIARALKEGQVTNADAVCATLEGLARGQGLVKSKQADKTFEDARSYIRTLMSDPRKAHLREIQLIRSELEVMLYLEPTNSRFHFLERRGRKALQMAEQDGYQRHAAQIRRLLHKNLN